MEDLHLARAIWKKFKPMIESPKRLMEAKRGRPKASERMAFLGICYMVWSGCSWRALPSKFRKKRAKFIGTSKSRLIRGYFRGFGTQYLFF